MYLNHKKQYPDFDDHKRLKCMEISYNKMNYMINNLRERKKRESVIEQEDINNTVELIFEEPMIGGEKISLTLQNKEKGLVGVTTAQVIKNEIKILVENEIFQRKVESELAKNQRDRSSAGNDYEHVCPNYLHHYWSTDYTFITILGVQFAIAEIYENYSQGYLSAVIDFAASTDIAVQALDEAIIFTEGKTPEFCLSDNGGQFTGDVFMKKLEVLEIKQKLTPAGEPWFNGALESGNRNLKNTIFSEAGLAVVENIEITNKIGVSKNEILKFAKVALKEALKTINEKIARQKFKTTPINVLTGNEIKKEIENNNYKKMKIQKRNTNKPNGGGSFIEKIKKGFNQKVKKMSIEKLFVIGELINGRKEFLTI